jgi:diguanylate cyclase (GGDEF)-like protein
MMTPCCGWRWRSSSDEFGVLLPEAQDESSILQLAERLLESVREPVRLAGVNGVVSVSMGVAVFPDHALDAERLLKAADTAMYAGKHSGKSGVRFAHSSG